MRRKAQGVGDALGVVAGDSQADALRRSDAQEHGLAALGPQRLEREIPAQPHVGEDLDAHVLDHADFAGDDLARQAIGGNGLHQHAAGPRLRFVDLRLVAQPGQEVGTGESGRAGADDGDLAPRVLRVLADLGQLDRHLLIDHESLDAANRNRLVQRRSAALVFAGVEADARADRRERIALAVQLAAPRHSASSATSET